MYDPIVRSAERATRSCRPRRLAWLLAVAAGAAVAGCATPATNTASGPVQQLGFTPVARTTTNCWAQA